jgi:hypothetical protein
MENSQEEVGAGLQKFMGLAQVDHVPLADNIKHHIKEGNINPLEMLITLKRLKQIVDLTISSEKGDKEIKTILREAVFNSLDGGKSIDIFGANLRLQATGTRYDFSACNDTVLNELVKIQEQVTALIKTRQDEIKALLPSESNTKLGIRTRAIIQTGFPSFTIDDSEWEDVINPPIKIAGESIICTFKKQK